MAFFAGVAAGVWGDSFYHEHLHVSTVGYITMYMNQNSIRAKNAQPYHDAPHPQSQGMDKAWRTPCLCSATLVKASRNRFVLPGTHRSRLHLLWRNHQRSSMLYGYYDLQRS